MLSVYTYLWTYISKLKLIIVPNFYLFNLLISNSILFYKILSGVLIFGSGSEWHSDKMKRSSNRHGASLCTEGHFGTVTKWHGVSIWHSDRMTRCVTLAQQQNDTVFHWLNNTFINYYFYKLVKKNYNY